MLSLSNAVINSDSKLEYSALTFKNSHQADHDLGQVKIDVQRKFLSEPVIDPKTNLLPAGMLPVREREDFYYKHQLPKVGLTISDILCCIITKLSILTCFILMTVSILTCFNSDILPVLHILLCTHLAAGWESKVSPEGRVFYVNEHLERTQWNHPLMDEELAEGWEKRSDQQGRTLYIDLHSGKPGIEESCHVQYTHPGEKDIAVQTRDNIVQLQHHLTRIMHQTLDNNDAALEREGMEEVAFNLSRREGDLKIIKDPAFKTYEGRLRTFVRPTMVLLQDGTEVNVGGWPHGYHLVSDRPFLSAMLKQAAIMQTGSAKGVQFGNTSKLTGIIPILEGYAFLRYGDGASARWDKLYLEIQQIADGTQDSILLMWGHLDPFNVHTSKVAMRAIGYFNTALFTKVSCVSLSTEDVGRIRAQNDALVQNLYGLRLESGDDDMKIAFLDEHTCLEWESNLRAPQLQRLGRLV